MIDYDGGDLIVCADEGARVDHERARAPRDRRADRGVLELHPGVLDRSLVGADDRVERSRRGAGGVALFPGTDAPFHEVFHPLRDDFGVGCLRGVALQVGFGLIQRGFQRAWVEREEHLARLDVIALTEVDRFHLSGHLRPDGHGGKGFHCAHRAGVEGHVLLHDPVDGNGNRGLIRGSRGHIRVTGRTGRHCRDCCTERR
jgi:hypothetical protein